MKLNRTQQPSIKTLDKFDLLKATHQELDNGIPLTILNAGDHPIVRLDFVFKAGQWYQSQNLQSIFTNRMLREGTQSYSASEISEKLDYYGALLDLSCASSYAYITLYALKKYVQRLLPIVKSIIEEPLFPEKELNVLINNRVQQHQINKEKVDFIAQRSFLRSLYGKSHPCGAFVEQEDFLKLSPETLKKFHKEYYHYCNCAIFVSGQVNEELITMLNNQFGSVPISQKITVEMPHYTIETQEEKCSFIEHPSAMQSSLKMGCFTIERSHTDYRKLKVLNTLFGGYFGSRLMLNIREDKGYTYGIYSGVFSYPDSGMFLITTEADGSYIDLIKKEVYHEIDRLHQDLVSDEELSIVKNYMLGELCRSYESPFSVIDAWIYLYTLNFDEEYFNRMVRDIQELTPHEIRELSHRYLKKEMFKETVAGKK